MRISDWSSDVCSSDLYSRKRQCGNGLCGDAFAASSKAQPFSGRRLHADLIRADAEYLPDSRTHGIAIRPDPGRLADYGEIHMTNAATPRDNSVAGKFQECGGSRSAPLCVGGRKVAADRSEERWVGRECVSRCKYGRWPDR